MGTAGTMARAQEEVNRAGTLAEAQAILNDLISQEQEVSDIFSTQEFTIQSLTDLLQKQDQSQPQTVYVSPPAPQPAAKNYMLYIGIGILFLVMTGGAGKLLKGFKL